MTPARRRIVVTTDGARYCRDVLASLEPDGAELVERYDLGDADDGPKLASGLEGAWGVVAGGEPYTDDVFRRAAGLRAIVRFGAGYDRVDLDAASANGVAVCTVPGANAEAVADLAVALMLACRRRLLELDAAVREGTWRPAWIADDLAHATVGIVGLGAIGKAVARRLRGFDCRLLAVEPRPDLDFCRRFEVELVGLDSLLPKVDLLTLHAPALPSTRRLIGARELALLPSHAIVVNTARGSLIDEAALVRALSDQAVGGAGLDVFEHEPLSATSPLTGLPNVVLTGHASSFTRLGADRTGQAVVETFRQLLAGRVPPNCLNPVAWTATAAAAP
jgi:D-3-phosphoglycerate dehydrogenase / 2-oxoglutarate reductase